MGAERTGTTAGRRWAASVAIALGVAYLTWRALDTLTGVPVWLAIGALVVEAAGIAATTALLGALAGRHRDAAVSETAGDELGPLDVVVRFDGQSLGHLHATLAGVRYMFDVRRVAVVTDRVDEATAAVQGSPVVVLPAEWTDTTRLRAAATFGEAPFVAVFDAGDVPQPGFTGLLRAEMADAAVAVVQGRAVVDGTDSAEHDAHGRHELCFERDVLLPALGDRGAAVLTGSGALIRRSALLDVTMPRGARRTAELRWSIQLRSTRRALVAPRQPIVATASINTERAVLAERRRAARAALVTLLSAQNPVWARRLGVGQRVGYLAWLVRPMSGLRRVAFVGLLIACVVTGIAPIAPRHSAWIVAGAWAASTAAQSWAVRRCSQGVLRAGDRARWSLRTMGASLASLLGPGRRLVGDSIDAARHGGWRSASRNPFLVLALLCLAGASVLIAVDRWETVLPADDPWTRAAAAAVAVWTIAMVLDVMRCLVGGPQLRAAQRLRVRLEATLDDAPARLTNLSPRGAGLHLDGEPDLIVGDEMPLRFLVPTGSGTTVEVATIVTVRSLRLDDGVADGTSDPAAAGIACGVEFGAMDRVSADALFAYCAVVHPARAAADPELAPPTGAARPSDLVIGSITPGPHVGVRLLGAVALLGIGVATMPPYGWTAAASDADTSTLTVRLVDQSGRGVPGATVVATCIDGQRVADDRDEVLDLARDAIAQTREQQRDAARMAADDRATRALRRETSTSAQARQAAALAEQQVSPALDPLLPEDVEAMSDPASAVGWHRIPAVEVVEAAGVGATDRGDGTYVVSDVASGACRVEVVGLPAGWAPAPRADGGGTLVQFVRPGGLDSAGAARDVFVTMAVRSVPTAGSGAEPDDDLVEIGDRVWLDVDGDGVQGPAEPGLAGVPVTLTIDGASHELLTDADGAYLFSSDPAVVSGLGASGGIEALRPGATVTVTTPVTIDRGGLFHVSQWTAGRVAVEDVVTDPAIDSTVDPSTGAVTFVVVEAGGPGPIDHTVDIGYSQGGAIGDLVWLDADNDGRVSAGEQGLDGVTVLLYRDTGGAGVPDGAPVAAEVTSEGGRYAFTGLPAGRYVIDVHPPVGMVSSTGALGRVETDDGAVVDDAGRMLATGVVRSPSIAVGDGQAPVGEGPTATGTSVAVTTRDAAMTATPDADADASVDFGLFAARAIDDAVWLDENGDGLLSADEPGLAGVAVSLLRGAPSASGDVAAEVLATTVTDADGDFVFPNLTLGEYTVQVDAPVGLRSIADLADDAEDDPDAPDGTVGVAVDTAPSTAPPVSVASEPPVPPTIDPQLDILDGTMDGVFTGIVENGPFSAAPPSAQAPEPPAEPNTEPVGEAQPAQPVPATAPVPEDDAGPVTFTLTIAPDWAGPDAARALQRFGLWAPRAIGDRVWEDADDDGVLDDDEVGIPGIVVRLLDVTDAGESEPDDEPTATSVPDDNATDPDTAMEHEVARTVTAVDGTYRFVDLPDGTYRIAMDVPGTWRTSSAGTDDPATVSAELDHTLAVRATGRIVSAPIRLGRVAVDGAGSFDRVDIGLFQPRPALSVATSVRGCSASVSTATLELRGGCAGTNTDADPAADADVARTARVPRIAAGAVVTLRTTVTNTGNVPLSGVVVTDDLASTDPLDCNGALPGDGLPLLLDVDRAVTCTATATVVTGSGHQTVTVDASAELAPGTVDQIRAAGPALADLATDTVHWVGGSGGLTLRTSVTTTSPGVDIDGDGVLDTTIATGAPTALADADAPGGADPTANRVVADGTRLWWVYDVENTGTSVLTDVAVVDTERATVCRNLVLAPGERRTCIVADVASRSPGDDGELRSVGAATAIDSSDPTVRVSVGPVVDAAHAHVVEPGIAVAVIVDGEPVDTVDAVDRRRAVPVALTAGATAEVAYVVTNTGDVAFPAVTLVDSTGPIDCAELSVGRDGLLPGEAVSCSVLRPVGAPPPHAASRLPDPAGPPPVDTVVRVDGRPAAVDGAVLDPVVVEATWSSTAATVAVSAHVFDDDDADGRRDADDRPVADIEVRLLDGDEEVVATTTTDIEGAWYVASLLPGAYSAQYVVPTGDRVTVVGAGGRVRAVLAPDGVFVTPVATIGADPGNAWDLGLQRPVAVSGSVSGADGSAPVAVVLSDAAGHVLGRSSTGSGGTWSFTDLAPAEHVVTLTAPDGRGLRLERGPVVASTSVRPGSQADVAVVALSRIDDRAWNDASGDGTMTGVDPPMPGVVVSLVATENGVAVPVAVATSDQLGRYAFTSAPPGDYVLALGAVVPGTPVADMTPGGPSASGTVSDSATPPGGAVLGQPDAAAAPLVLDGAAVVEPALRLTVTPETRSQVAPGRAANAAPSVLERALDPNEWVPTSGPEVIQAGVFVVALLVLSLVAATAHRRRLR